MKLRELNTELGRSSRIYQGLTPATASPQAPLAFSQVDLAITILSSKSLREEELYVG